MGFRFGWVLVLLASPLWASAPRIGLCWPTPNTAYLEGRPIGDYIQPTVSGAAESGLFGCSRSGGTQFHEGVDLKPVSRDRRGEPEDSIFAAMAGVVSYVNLRVADSNYGRYIVLEHPGVQPAVYTLYAHLGAVAPGLKAGDRVARGQVIATMGHTANEGGIPRSRAHLHFEVGLMMTRDFQAWYDWMRFDSPNPHGCYNGMNLMGIDPLDFLDAFRARRVDNFRDYFAGLPAVARVRIATRRVPDFVLRYPSLLMKPVPPGGVAGWEIKVAWTGLPFSWTPLDPADVAGWSADEVRLSDVDAEAVRKVRCRSVAVPRDGGYVLGRDLNTVLQQVFGRRE